MTAHRGQLARMSVCYLLADRDRLGKNHGPFGQELLKSLNVQSPEPAGPSGQGIKSRNFGFNT